MARQRLNEKNTRKLAAATGLPVERVLVRGGTDHRRDLCLADGSIVHSYRDGSMEASSMRWERPAPGATLRPVSHPRDNQDASAGWTAR